MRSEKAKGPLESTGLIPPGFWGNNGTHTWDLEKEARQ